MASQPEVLSVAGFLYQRCDPDASLAYISSKARLDEGAVGRERDLGK